jgi:hypothetical protein
MRPLRYSIKVTLDGCCDHRAKIADEDLHRDTLLFGRVTYEMMEAAWWPPSRTGARPDWMEPFARTIRSRGAGPHWPSCEHVSPELSREQAA